MTTTQYIGGLGNNTLYRERSYIKIGTVGDGSFYRGVVVINPKTQIENAIKKSAGLTAANSYKIGKADLILTSTVTRGDAPDLYAIMLPLGASIDDSVSWTLHSEQYKTSWNTEGGDIEPSAKDILIKGNWNDTLNPIAVTFDLTEYFSIWKTSETSSFAIAIIDDGNPKEVLRFHSNESQDILLGGTPLTNCRFFTGTESQVTSIEGVRVLMIPSGTTTSITLVDPSCEAQKRWDTFNAAATVGSTCSIFSPDTEQGLVLGSNVCTITEKTAGVGGASIVVSGLCLGSIENYYTTAEFTTAKNINSGKGYVEITNPSQKLLDDINTLLVGDVLSVKYQATVSSNNVRQYTVTSTANEKATLNRARIYFNEQVVSENRNGMMTELRVMTSRPLLQTQIII